MIGGGHHDNQNLHRPPDEEIYEISAIYLACVVVAVLMVALLVDPLSRYIHFDIITTGHFPSRKKTLSDKDMR